MDLGACVTPTVGRRIVLTKAPSGASPRTPQSSCDTCHRPLAHDRARNEPDERLRPPTSENVSDIRKRGQQKKTSTLHIRRSTCACLGRVSRPRRRRAALEHEERRPPPRASEASVSGMPQTSPHARIAGLRVLTRRVLRPPTSGGDAGTCCACVPNFQSVGRSYRCA